MGVASGYLAVLVLALYINTDTAQAFYSRYQLIWFECPLLFYWISHVWLIAHRGKMPDDPVVFAVSDHTSRILALLMLVVTLVCAMTGCARIAFVLFLGGLLLMADASDHSSGSRKPSWNSSSFVKPVPSTSSLKKDERASRL